MSKTRNEVATGIVKGFLQVALYVGIGVFIYQHFAAWSLFVLTGWVVVGVLGLLYGLFALYLRFTVPLPPRNRASY
jgi:hypothetical protein